MPVTQPQCAAVFKRLGLPFTRAAGRDHRHAAELALRPDDRGRPDRGGDPRHRLRQAAADAAAGAGHARARCPKRGAALNALRRALAALGYQETINFSFVEERWERELAGNADPIRVLNPIAAPLAVMRSSLLGSLVDVLRYNLARKATRVRVFEIGRVFRARRRRRPTATSSVAGMRQPMRVAALAYGSADALQWGAAERAGRLLRRQGRRRGAVRAARRCASSPPRIRRCIPGRSARVELDGARRRLHRRAASALAPGLRAAARAGAVRARRRRARARDMPSFAPLPRQQSVWRDIAVIVADKVTHDELIGASCTTAAPELVRSARLFDVYKPEAAGRRHRRRRAQHGGAARAARRRRHVDRRAHRRGGRSASSMHCAAASARGCAA